ncbi:MAG: CPBP family intramembrane metalloprotease [Chloroflexi bacterium]|nr:CPBP family intramembrane metalloprotease [Chloroflexota bacterium]
MNNFSEQPPPAIPWTPRDVAWGLLGFVLWILFFIGVGLVGATLQLPIDTGILIVFGEAILLLPAWYFTIHKYGVTWADLGLRSFQPGVIGRGCGLMLASVVFNLVYLSLLSLYNNQIQQIQPEIARIFEGTSFSLALLFGGAVVAPFVEEVFFRGFVFAGLRGKWGWPRAAVASAGLFALAHVAPISIAPIFILGLIFAFLYQISGSIWPGILMHILTNTVALLGAYANAQGWLPTP